MLRYGGGVKLYTTHEHWLVCPMHVLFRYNREPCVEPHCLRCTLAFRRPPQLWRYTGLLERSVPHVDLFLSPSRFTLEAHRARGFTRPMRHLPLLPTRRATIGRRQEPVGAARPYFLFVGRLEQLKGVQVLVEVVPRLSRGRSRSSLASGTYGDELRRQAAGLDHVRFLGRVHPAELDALYAGAIALLVPSVGYEMFGIVIARGIRPRTPAIVHDLGRAAGGDRGLGRSRVRLPDDRRAPRRDATACGATPTFARARRAGATTRGSGAGARSRTSTGYFAAIEEARGQRR